MFNHKKQNGQNRYKTPLGQRVFSLALLCLLANKSLFNSVQAVNADKVSFEMFEIDSPLLDIMWCGNTNEVILVQTEKGTIYRSRDRGDAWKKLHSIMQKTGESVIDGSQDIGKVKKMMQSPIDDSLVVFTGTHGVNWVTEDCGANLRALNSGKRIHELQYHPRQRSWALAAGWTSCKDFADDEPCEIYKELYITKDLGQSWQYLKSYVFDFAWGTTKYSAGLSGNKNVESRIFITNDPELKGHQKTRERWKQSVHLYYSDDFFKTQKNALDAGNSIVMTNHYMFVAKAISAESIKIHVSRAEAGFLDFRLARMPKNYHITDHFTVMDTSEKSVFLYVSDDSVVDSVGNLFVSDGLGYRFTHSLENIIKGANAVDFETVESLEGTFIANRYDVNHGEGNNKNAGQLRDVTEDDIADEEEKHEGRTRMSTSAMNGKQGMSKRKSQKKGKKSKSLENFDEKIKTYISHNKGSTWELIRAPQKDLKGKATKCYIEDQCSLHINMYTKNDQMYAPPYSQESAIGVVMAIGNVGERLEFGRGQPKGTYLSRDGGLTWSEIAKIPLIYEFGDHGGLLVAAPNIQSTTQVRYSWNEGKTWTKLKISQQPIFIDNIIIEPKSTSQQFVIYGSYDNSTEKDDDGDHIPDIRGAGEDLMITLDFTGLQEPRCKGVDTPEKADSDFELWSPHDDGRHGSNNKCFLGQQVTYVRRKQDSECFNGEDFERQTRRVPCLCTEADYECDMNFVRNKLGKCEPLKDLIAKNQDKQNSEKEEDCALEGFYSISQGYRKIPGNMCYGGLQMDPIKKPCTKMVWISSLFKGQVIFQLILLGLVGYYGWPIIESIILILPIPDPQGCISSIKNLGGFVFDFIGSVFSKPQHISMRSGSAPAGYQQNLNQAPGGLNDDEDDSDDDIGKPMTLASALDDDDSDEETLDVEAGIPQSTGSAELIDLGGESNETSARSASSIPRLSGPR